MIDVRSLKVRLMVLAALSIGLVLTVAGVSLTVLFEQHVTRRVAAELGVRWNEIAGEITLDSTDRPVLTQQPTDPRYDRPHSGLYWQIDAPGGEPLRSRSLWDETLKTGDTAVEEAVETPGFGEGAAAQLYVLSRPLNLVGSGGPVRAVLSVAVDHGEINALSDAYASELLGALVVIAAALFLGALLQAQVGLQPLAALRRSIAAIRSGTSARMGGGFATEIQPLADDLDRMLDWRDTAVAKARDRAGALAHGFKTPLTILSLEARKLAEQGQPASAEVLREQVETMRRHVERELARARIRGGSVGRALGAEAGTEIAPVTRGLVDLMRRMPHAEALSFEIVTPAGLQARVDRHDLGEVLGNLLDNARKWAASRIEIRAERAGDLVTISVIDDGPGFGAEPPAGREAEGSGLGLAIVEDVLSAYGATLERRREENRTLMSFKVPAAEPAVLDAAAE
nr:HAMP domain-containing sensor histidine kinase [Chthonobacter albigriseus]